MFLQPTNAVGAAITHCDCVQHLHREAYKNGVRQMRCTGCNRLTPWETGPVVEAPKRPRNWLVVFR